MIASKTGKIPITKVWQTGNPTDITWRDILTSLFRNLGFDQADPKEVNAGGGPPADSQQMVANLIDYLDSDQTNYQQNNFASGVESDLPDGAQFRNEGVIDSLASELASIPGFTPGRVQRILPFVYVSSKNVGQVNINAAPYEVLAAMIDPSSAQQIVQCRQGSPGQKGGFQSVSDLQTCGVAPSATQGSNFSVAGTLFEVIAKVEYGTASFMASAELSGAGGGKLPTVTNFQVY
jgi:type II secretory pathway component PulK